MVSVLCSTDASSKQLRTADGTHCVTASSPKSKIKQATLVMGRPLGLGAPHSYAMVFLNNLNRSASVTCDAACMANMLALRPNASAAAGSSDGVAGSGSGSGSGSDGDSVSYDVQEVWSGGKKVLGAPIKCTASSCDPVTVTVEGHGGTTYVRLVPKK